jgi:hypothetical protein
MERADSDASTRQLTPLDVRLTIPLRAEQRGVHRLVGSTPHLHLETGHVRDMPKVVRDQSHTLGYRM